MLIETTKNKIQNNNTLILLTNCLADLSHIKPVVVIS